MLFLWLKALHIIFVVCWFAGIFYLPRLFVYYAMSDHEETRTQLLVMQRKLYRFMSLLAVLAIGFGLALMLTAPGYYLEQAWFWLKILLVGALGAYHLVCGRYIGHFEIGEPPRPHIYYRWFNEAPVILLFAIVLLVVLKPAG